MSMLPEIAQAFQNAIDDWLAGVKELAQQILPDADEHTAFMQSEYMHSRGLMAVDGAMYFPNNTSSDWGKAIYVEYDLYVNNGSAFIANPVYVAKAYNNGNYATDAEAEAELVSFIEALPTFHTTSGTISCLIYTDEITLRAYDGGVYNPNNVYMTYGNMTKAGRERNYPGGKIMYTGVSYTVDSDHIISLSGATEYQLDPDSQWYGLLWALSGYPWVGNVKDLTYINNFVNKMNSTGQSTHNYTGTYTTPDNKTIRIYYGDNYTFTYVDDDEPVSYDDIKNAINIAITQINDDNDTDIHTEPWSPTPPPPPEPTDYSDDNFGLTTTGFSSNIGGAGNYWLMDLTTLAGFISDFKTTAPAGSMISQNILSCYVNALNCEWETGQDNIVIHAAGAQNTPYTSTSTYDYIYQYNPHVVVGQYKVPRVTETFYDFNPYSTYELYIPFCGWIGLPDTVAGRNIRVYMDFDVATMSCKAYVMVEMEDGSGDTICGEITGSFGAPCPVQVIEGGLYKQAMINSGLQIASGVVSGLMGGAFGGPVGASMLAEGGMNAVQGLASAYMAGNTNYGQTIGRAGDTSGLCGGHYCYIKITHPVIDEVVDTETFGHTTGYPCYMESELSALAGTGFTVCLNPHVHVNCTQSEKEEIKRLLESGVIL